MPTEATGSQDRFSLFEAGRLMATSHAMRALPEVEVMTALGRHLRGDWGDVGQEDWEANQHALAAGERLFSVYHTHANLKFWIITEADRSATTVLMPEDY